MFCVRNKAKKVVANRLRMDEKAQQPQRQRASIILNLVRFLPLLLVLLAPTLARSAPLPAFEGTVSQTQNGLVSRAKIAWAPPDTLRIEILPDSANGIAGSVLVARGEQTLVLDKATGRVRRAPYNLATNWWRGAGLGSGGAANFLFAGTAFPADSAPGRFLLRDTVIFGGSGKDVYYAARKAPVRRYAAQIAVTGVSRIEKNEAGKVTLEAQITLDGAGLPRASTVVSSGESASFAYDLKALAAPPVIEEIEAPITEDTDLQSPSAYAGNDASSHFNRGASLAQNEDAPRAIAAFQAASQAAPTATAPQLALFEIAFAMRDAQSAQKALDILATLPIDKAEIEVRRARLALLNRDRASALVAFKNAEQSAPQNATLRLAQAEILRSQSDFEGARAFYREVLATPSRQFGAQRAAAESLALGATFEELPALLQSIPLQGANEAQQLARALLQLRLGQTPEAAEFARDEFLVALALGFERAAHDDDAGRAWQTLEKRAPDALKNRARAHLMTLAARRGDVAGAITRWREWNAALPLQSDRDAAQDAFFAAFQKAFRSDALQSALANRATATAATEDDLRLFLAYQETYGTPEDIVSAIDTGANRFPKSAFWMGKRAENLLAEANDQRSNQAGTARREQLYEKAFVLLNEAIKIAPDEPFYRSQKALAATQRAIKTGAIIDATISTRNRAAAARETAALLADFPDDPDVLVSAALQNLALENDAGAREAIRLASRALDAAPGEGDGDRHTLIWAAHQALASAYKRLNQPELAAAQWETLLLGARDAGEQATLASSYFAFLDGLGEANAKATTQSAARLLAQLALEKWSYAAARGLLESVASRMALSPRAGAIAGALAAMKSEGATLANATLALRRVEATQRALEAPNPPPPAADADLERANRDLGAALAQLRVFAQSPNRAVAARAAAFVAENSVLSGIEQLELLRSAIEKEPRDAGLRFALIGALDAPQAQKELEIAAQILDFNLETRRAFAAALRRAGDAPGALRVAEEAFAAAARAPETGSDDLQRIAFTLAKSAFAANQNSRALELYNGLSLPQWNEADRAAAMMALSRNYHEAKRDDDAAKINARIPALQLSQPELETALAFVDEVE